MESFKKGVELRINRVDVKDYIFMRISRLSTATKWIKSKDLKLDNGLTLSENCVEYFQPSNEALIDEPSIETLKKLDEVFKFNIW